jgi:hypothetical protein
MQITAALRSLMQVQSHDRSFSYLEFLDTFLVVERWAKRADSQKLEAFLAAGAGELLGEPLGECENDRRLGFVLDLLRQHGEEIIRWPRDPLHC